MENKKRILVVDDEQDTREVITCLLESQGWECIQGEDGEEAVALSATHQPDAVLLDVMMPGKGGLEAFKEMREDCRTSHIPVIFVSSANDYGLGEAHDARRSMTSFPSHSASG